MARVVRSVATLTLANRAEAPLISEIRRIRHIRASAVSVPPRTPMKRLLLLCPVALLSFATFADAASPKARKAPGAASRTYAGKPTTDRGTLPDADATIPDLAARAVAASEIVGAPTTLEMLWASVTPRRPRHDNDVALVFTHATLVDAKRGIASWPASGATPAGGSWTPPNPEDLGCLLFGCPGGEDAGGDRGLQLWVKGAAADRFYAECRVRFEGKKGTVAVKSDGFDASFTVDHTGKTSARIGWVIDPTEAGWFGFSLSSATAWTTYGCTLDKMD